MKFYIAAKYARRFELRALRDALQAMGHPVTSQWLDNAEESKGQAAAAEMDVADVLEADAIVFMGEPRGSQNSGGGRWFELGVAFQAGKVCHAILPPSLEPHGDERGRNESVFTSLPSFYRHESVEEFLGYVEVM
jgi:nucleoside 2-deoxyribosyltransferase